MYPSFPGSHPRVTPALTPINTAHRAQNGTILLTVDPSSQGNEDLRQGFGSQPQWGAPFFASGDLEVKHTTSQHESAAPAGENMSALEPALELDNNSCPVFLVTGVQDTGTASDAGYARTPSSSFAYDLYSEVYPTSPCSPQDHTYYSTPQSQSSSSMPYPSSWDPYSASVLPSLPSSIDGNIVQDWLQDVSAQPANQMHRPHAVPYTPFMNPALMSPTGSLQENGLGLQVTGSDAGDRTASSLGYDQQQRYSNLSAVSSPTPSSSSLPHIRYRHSNDARGGSFLFHAANSNGAGIMSGQIGFGSRPLSYPADPYSGGVSELMHPRASAHQHHATSEYIGRDDPHGDALLCFQELTIASPPPTVQASTTPRSPTSPYSYTGSSGHARGRSRQWLDVPEMHSSRSQSSSDYQSSSDPRFSPATSFTSMSESGESTKDAMFSCRSDRWSTDSNKGSNDGTILGPGTPSGRKPPRHQSTIRPDNISSHPISPTLDIDPLLSFSLWQAGPLGPEGSLLGVDSLGPGLVSEPLGMDTMGTSSPPQGQYIAFPPQAPEFNILGGLRGTGAGLSGHADYEFVDPAEGSTSKGVEAARGPAQRRHHSPAQSKRRRQDQDPPRGTRKTKDGRTFTSVADEIHKEFQRLHDVRIPWSLMIHRILRRSGTPLTRRAIVRELLHYSRYGPHDAFENYLAQRLGHWLSVSKQLFARGPDHGTWVAR